ncbi:hypothetical protein [Alkalicoccus luteus]|uniref:Lipoprotein n=1 Tax=Alkalicoccus luteus TaxID=1237094 RepID=A0A969PRM4_9BACI|nr:hypothetical protein [Alkalicoccus luteus]NJP37754.1 hypothetical protein [Alkalicoccus luteus]
MKKSIALTGAVTASLVLAACGNAENNGEENDGADNNAPENNTAEENNADENADNEANENEEAEDGGEIEDLASEYDIDVTVGEGDGGEEASMEELEELFAAVAAARDADMLPKDESPDEGEGEESGTAEGYYLIPGAEESDMRVLLSFSYELEGDLEDESRFPSFGDVSDSEISVDGSDVLSWNADSVEEEIVSAGTGAEFQTAGAWHIEVEVDGQHVEAEEEDEFILEFSTGTLVGIE